MSNSKQIKIGAVLSYLSIGVNILAGLLYTPWMVQQIGKSDYSLFTLVNALITMFMIDFGLSSATARYVAKYRAENRQQKVNDFLGAVYKLYLIIDFAILVVLTVVYIFLDQIYVTLSADELSKLKVVYLIAAGFSLFNFPFVTLNGILTAYEKFIQIKLADLIYRFLIVGLMVAALSLGGGLYAVVIVNAAAGVVTTAFKLITVKKTTPVKVNFQYFDRDMVKKIFSFSIWTTVSMLAQRLVFNITPSILAAVAGSGAIAVFGIISTIEGYTYTVTTAINGMFLPKISRIYAGADADNSIMPLMLKVGRFQYALNGLIVAGFIVLGKEFILLWMGPDYLEAYIGIILVIVPGIFFNSLQIANTAMVVQKKVKQQAYIALITGVVNVCVSVVLSGLYGAIGASLSIFLAYMIRAILYIAYYHRSMKLNMMYFVKYCYVKMSIPIVATIFFGWLISWFFVQYGWVCLVVKAGIVVLIYLLFTCFVSLTKEERRSIAAMINQK